MKRFTKILLLILILPMLASMIWFGVQRWPYEQEAPLWSEKDLDVIAVSDDENAWLFLVKMKDELVAPLELLPKDLEKLLVSKNDVEPEFYWEDARFSKDELLEFFDDLEIKRPQLISILNNYTRYPHFVDRTEVKLEKSWIASFSIIELNQLACLFVNMQVLKGDWEKVHELLLQQTRFALEWAQSSRSFVSRRLALQNFLYTLKYLKLVKQIYPEEKWQEISQLLGSVDWEKLSFKQVLIYEYLYRLRTIDIVTNYVAAPSSDESNDDLSKDTPNYDWKALFFNRAWLRNQVNKEFREYQKLLQNPGYQIPDEFNKLGDIPVTSSEKLAFYLCPNESFLSILRLPLAERIHEYNVLKKQMKEILIDMK